MPNEATAQVAPAAEVAPDAGAILAQLGIDTSKESDANVDTVSTETDAGDDSTGSEGGGESGDGSADAATADDAASSAAKDGDKSQSAAARREAFKALFTEEALGTPEGVKAAAAALRSREIKQHEAYNRTEKREKAAKEDSQRARAAEATFNNMSGQLQRMVEPLFTGTGEQALEALGRLRKKDGIAAYEELTDAVIAKKKNAPAAADVKVAELEAKLTKFEQDQQHERIVADNRQWAHALASTAIANTAEGKPANPGITHFIKVGKLTLREVVDTVAKDKIEFNKANPGRVLSDRDALAAVELALADLVPAAPAAPPQSAANRLAARLPGRGVPPARAAGGSGSRELSEEERMAEIANDPVFLRQMGLEP